MYFENYILGFTCHGDECHAGLPSPDVGASDKLRMSQRGDKQELSEQQKMLVLCHGSGQISEAASTLHLDQDPILKTCCDP